MCVKKYFRRKRKSESKSERESESERKRKYNKFKNISEERGS